MSQQLLHRPNVVPIFEQVGRERVWPNTRGDSRQPRRRPDRALNDGLVYVKP